MEKMKVSFIGCGGIARAHAERLLKLGNVDIVSVCDTDSNNANAMASSFNGKAFTDFRHMFESTDMDACYICVPPFAHHGQELECIDRGIPFFIEKPVNLNLDEAEDISLKIAEKKLITSAGYVLRYYDVIDRAKKMREEKGFALFRGKYYGEVPAGGAGWIPKKKLSGGQLIEQSTHILDLMRYIAGEITEVHAADFKGINSRRYKGYDVEDASIVSLKFKNGAIGSLTSTWLLKGFNSSLEMVGQEVLCSYAGNSLTVEKTAETTTYFSEMDIMLEEDTAFITAVKTGDTSGIKSDYADALKTLKVTIRAHDSIIEGKPIKLY